MTTRQLRIASGVLVMAAAGAACWAAAEKEGLPGPTPEWIWASGTVNEDETVYFRKTFRVESGEAGGRADAWLTAACDNAMTVWLNGAKVASGDSWEEPVTAEAAEALRSGENVLAVQARNAGGAAGLILRLELAPPAPEQGDSRFITTDKSWRATRRAPAGSWKKPGFDASGWGRAVSQGELGAQPWGAVGFMQAVERSKPLARWRFVETARGWEANKHADLSVSQAMLHVEHTGRRPWIRRQVQAPAGMLVVAIRVRSAENQVGQLFWTTEKHGKPADVRSERFNIPGGNKWREQRIRFRAGSNLTGLRIDTGTGPGRVEIQSITLRRGSPDRPLATAAGALELPDGFQAELLYSVPKEEQGSWVAMTFDDQGRIITSTQYGRMYRVTPPPIGSDRQTRVEQLDVKIGMAQGLLYAFDSLYVVVNGKAAEGNGLYRVRDTDGDDQYDEVELLRKIAPRRGHGAEHGPHSIRLGPDGESLYVIGGNMAGFPVNGPEKSRVPRAWGEDQLLERMPDARGHARTIMAPGGWICRTDPDGETWTLICSGFRNPYDFDFNQAGEIFTYDADMEWDVGTPWYRPTRINHAVSGGEFGWRNGTGKWPAYYPDSLPAAVNTGKGSPTGVVFGYGAKFPAKYQRALFALDWAYGIIYAVHLEPEGASYTGDFETFIEGEPLPVTDVAIGPDGAMYFTTGGRRTQSGLYRVTYTGDEPTAPIEADFDPEAKEARQTRHMLEQYHHEGAPAKAVDVAWGYLDHEDRFIRWAARVAIEHQPVERWYRRALEETDPQASLAALLALARLGEPAMQDDLLHALGRLEWSGLSEGQKLAALRVLGLAFIRMGEPDEPTRQEVAARLAPHYPASSTDLNIELSRMLAYLEAPKVVPTTLGLLAEAKTQQEQIHYALVLRNVRTGWNLDRRKAYFAWFNEALSRYSGGASFEGFLKNIRKEALAHVPADQKKALQPILENKPEPAGPSLADVEPRTETVERWTIEKLMPAIEGGLRKRDYERGRRMYAAARCYSCHRFNGEGGALGPDLTGVAGRFSPRDLLVSIIKPNKAISDQYQSHIITTGSGQVFGRILSEEDGTLRVAINPLDPEQVKEIPTGEIESKVPAPVSLMPPALINTLKKDEVLDLMAYLLSGGDREAEVFH